MTEPSSARARPRFARVMGLFDVTLFTVCAILVIDTLAASAAIGASALSWWVITFGLFFIPYGLIAANPGYALIARRHMHEFGTTPEQMAKVAVDQRKNACKNPAALFGNKEITVDDVLNSRVIVDPLHLLEIVSPCTGGGAFIVTGAERSKRAPHRPVYLLGAGEAGGHCWITRARSLTTSLVKPAAEAAFKMAGMTPQDMDFVQPYDCYTITVIVTLEDAGFCKKGEGGHFVWEHDLTYKGDFPCNTHGGQLSFGQPGLAGGMSHVIEAVRQLMGRGGERQENNQGPHGYDDIRSRAEAGARPGGWPRPRTMASAPPDSRRRCDRRPRATCRPA
ncbi:MAG: thiolase family protein [Dehalococcoidia bacterium]|nr:thiolase family protein [Dehalococcoidia bacterium]